MRSCAALWRAAAYPLTVLAGVMFVLIFLGHFVLPQFAAMYRHWYQPLPGITVALFDLAQFTPVILVVAIVLFVGLPILWALLRATHLDRAAADLALPIPLVGTVLKRNLIARWCDALRLAVESGMDLPAAIKLSCDVVGSPALKRDGAEIVAHLTAGRFLDQLPKQPHIIPTSVLAVVQLSSDKNDLPNSLETLATMYQQQADLRLASLQAALTPMLLLLVAGLIAVVILGLFAPMISIFRLFN